MNRWTPFVIGVGLSIGLTAALWAIGLPGFFLLLGLPIFLWPRRGALFCPRCGHETMHPAERYCPLDGEQLERKR